MRCIRKLLKASLVVSALCISASLYAQEQKEESTQSSPPQSPTEQPQLPKQVRVSQGVTQGLLITRVQPEYPKKARKKHLQGTVVMQAVISQTGDIKDLKVVSGDELLVPSAVKAVKQWKYKPYLLQGRPVEVLTEITVNYTLNQ